MKIEVRRFSFFDEPPTDPDPKPTPRTYTQEELDIATTNEKKRAEDRIRALSKQLDELKGVSGQKTDLEKKIQELQDSLLTKEELAAKALREKEEASAQEREILTGERDTWKTRFQTSLVNRELLDAAQAENAFNPGIFSALLRDNISVTEETGDDGKGNGNFKVNVKLVGTGKDKKPTTLTLDPRAAIKHLKEQPEYGYLFRDTKNPGAGLTSNGKPVTKDMSEVTTMDDWKEARKQMGLK